MAKRKKKTATPARRQNTTRSTNGRRKKFVAGKATKPATKDQRLETAKQLVSENLKTPVKEVLALAAKRGLDVRRQDVSAARKHFGVAVERSPRGVNGTHGKVRGKKGKGRGRLQGAKEFPSPQEQDDVNTLRDLGVQWGTERLAKAFVRLWSQNYHLQSRVKITLTDELAGQLADLRPAE